MSRERDRGGSGPGFGRTGQQDDCARRQGQDQSGRNHYHAQVIRINIVYFFLPFLPSFIPGDKLTLTPYPDIIIE